MPTVISLREGELLNWIFVRSTSRGWKIETLVMPEILPAIIEIRPELSSCIVVDFVMTVLFPACVVAKGANRWRFVNLRIKASGDVGVRDESVVGGDISNVFVPLLQNSSSEY